MKHIQRFGAGFLLVIVLSIPAFAGETQTPPGETQGPPPGETQGPGITGETQGPSITGDILGPGIINLILSLL